MLNLRIGETVENSPDSKLDKINRNQLWNNCTKIGHYNSWGTLNRGRHSDDYNGFLFPKKEYLSLHQDWKWQVQVWELYCKRLMYRGKITLLITNISIILRSTR